MDTGVSIDIARGGTPRDDDPLAPSGMANENPSWGEERIANELLLKLGIQVFPRTVSKYLPKRPTRRPRRDMR